jgi:hypothetical protein
MTFSRLIEEGKVLTYQHEEEPTAIIMWNTGLVSNDSFDIYCVMVKKDF